VSGRVWLEEFLVAIMKTTIMHKRAADKFCKALLIGAALSLGLVPAMALSKTGIPVVDEAPDNAWRSVDPENTMVLDLPSGEMLIELHPELAPKSVERIKTLTRQGFYDGIAFHRVIDGFMAQGGDPTGTGSGGSSLPDLKGEFFVDAETLASQVKLIGRDSKAARVGFLGAVPVSAQPESLKSFLTDGTVGLWGSHCPGVMSMARTSDPNSANSQFFLMFADNRDTLDATYAVWGRIIDGEENARRIARGEPPERPTPIVRARILADIPVSERENIEIMRTDSQTFDDYLDAIGAVSEDGFVKDICGIRIPKRINGETEL